MDQEQILARLVRVGIVTDVDNAKHKARVKFSDVDMTSGWLHVLDNRPSIPGNDVEQRTEFEQGGSGDAEFAKHKHDLIVSQWMPKVNDTVLVLYLPIFNSDGFVLGGIK